MKISAYIQGYLTQRYYEKCFENMLVNIIEPVGSKAPSFTTKMTITGYEMRGGTNFALLCPAQALPVPSFRYYHFIVNVVSEVS